MSKPIFSSINIPEVTLWEKIRLLNKPKKYISTDEGVVIFKKDNKGNMYVYKILTMGGRT